MKLNIDPYIGEWVAICNKKIVSHGKNVNVVFKEAIEKCSKEKPFIAKVPSEKTMIF